MDDNNQSSGVDSSSSQQQASSAAAARTDSFDDGGNRGGGGDDSSLQNQQQQSLSSPNNNSTNDSNNNDHNDASTGGGGESGGGGGGVVQQQQQASSSNTTGGMAAATSTNNNNNINNSSNNNGNGGGFAGSSSNNGNGGGGGNGGGVMDASREARIAARKARIEANRLAKTKTEKQEDSNTRKKVKEPERKDASKSKAQMAASKKRTDTVKMSGTDQVTSVRVAVVAREAQRRLEEVRKMDIWERKKREEAEKSADAQQAIEAEWDKCFKADKGPYAMFELLLEQKTSCDSLISTKNKLINEYISELKAKDDEYVKELKRQAEEIDILLSRMDSQYKTFQATLWEEFDQIEKAFVEERTELIESNVKEIENLFIMRRKNESKFMEERVERIEDHIHQLEQLRVHDAEEYNLVKIKLETDVKVLEQQLQQMRATYQLNTEKLEYNFQVLKKREEENGTILGAQKRKIARLTDHLNTLKAKLAKQEKGFHQEYIALTDDYKRITEQFKELQKKFRHFQIADGKKYKDVWKMNEEIAKESMRKVLQADRIIYEQQLGIEWTPPDEDLFKSIEPKAFQKSLAKSQKQDNEPGVAAILAASISKSDDEGDTGGEEDGGVGNASEIKESFGVKGRKVFSKTMKKMLELLCNEAGFLVEERLQKLLAPLHKDEQSLMKLDSIFKAIGVETVEDIQSLTNYFIAKTAATDLQQLKLQAPHTELSVEEEGEAETDNTNPDSSSDPNNQQHNSSLAATNNLESMPQFISPNEVVKAIRRFVEDQRNEKQKIGPVVSDDNQLVKYENGMGAGGDEDTQLERYGGGGEIGAGGAGDERDELEKSEDKYWERVSNVIDDKNFRTWTAVYSGMEKYNKQLSERWQLTSEIGTIARQNEELRQLLRQYMAASVNDELQIPPTRIMLAQAGMLHQG